MKKNGIIVVIVLIIGALFLWKSDIFLNEEQKVEKKMKQQIEQLADTKFSTLPQITMDEAEEKINKNQDIIIYFGWVETCGDALNFQVNSFDDYLQDDAVFKNIYVVNLDKEAPDALSDQELRKPIANRFQIDQWTKDETISPMELKSPQLVHYQNGEIVDLVSWTPLNTDAKFGILKEKTDLFFDNLNY